MITILISFYLSLHFLNGNSQKIASVELSYGKGIAAYSGERWSECIAQFEDALHLYKLYRSATGDCRQQCNNRKFDPIVTNNIEDLSIYEKYFQRAKCIMKCHEQIFSDLSLESDLNENILEHMRNRKPYEYLHICYFQMRGLPKAASAAYTYLVIHPDDDQMKVNLKYYLQQQEVNKDEVIDLESEEYEINFKKGVQLYEESKWEKTVDVMEKAIHQYIAWEDKCRVNCDYQPQEQDWSAEFVLRLSNNMESVLRCRQKCQDALKKYNFISGNEFLVEVLNYLQMSYYRLDKLHKAAKSVASSLVLDPNESDMLANKDIYKSLVGQEAFEERSDIIYYSKRDSFEKKLLSSLS